MKTRALIAFTAAVVAGVIAFIFVEISSVGGPNVGVKEASAACSGRAPDCLPELDMIDLDGNTWTRDSLAGKVVVINFWATWCAPCEGEIPDLARFYDRYRDRDVVLLGLMTDDVSAADFEAYAERTGLNYPVVRVDNELALAFEYPAALPTTFVYDRTGKLVFERAGAVDEALLSGKLENIL